MKFTFAPESRPLEGYTIKRAIYRGGFGEVYYALTDAGREVALKLLQNNAEVELRGVQQCLNLSHPNLVTIFDVKQDRDGDHWIVMEYVAGETLDAAVHRYPNGMPMEEVRNWLRGIADGVGFLHDQGIVHRDLKPGNVFSEAGLVKIGDVGLSKFITPSRRSAQTQSVGTVYYMAPEVAKGRYGREVDVYSLGVMLYEMITGRVPFEGESTGEILMKHLSETPDLEPLPPRLRPVIGAALQKDPAKRIASVTELQQAFEAAVLGKSPAADEHVRVVVTPAPPTAPPADQPGRAPADRISELEQTVVDKDDRDSSIWSPTRRAFWIILACGVLGLLFTGEHGLEGVLINFVVTGMAYFGYAWGKEATAQGTAPPQVVRAVRWMDGDSKPLFARGLFLWTVLLPGWFLVVNGAIADADPGEVLAVAVPFIGLLLVSRSLISLYRFLFNVPSAAEEHRKERVYHEAVAQAERSRAQASPVPPPPVRPVHHHHQHQQQRRRRQQPRMARHYYRNRQATPGVFRAMSFRTRLTQSATSATLVVPIVALLTVSVELLSPQFFASVSGAGPGWENVGLFASTAIIASWVLIGLSKWNEGRRLDGGTRRLLQMVGGVAVGLAAYGISETLLIAPTPPPDTYAGTLWSQPGNPMFKSVGDRPLYFEGGLPSLLGYVVFFGVLFGLRRWWWHADAFRPKRFRLGSVIVTVLLAWLVSSIWAFPSVWAMTLAAVISSAVQLASVWTPPEERFIAKEV